MQKIFHDDASRQTVHAGERTPRQCKHMFVPLPIAEKRPTTRVTPSKFTKKIVCDLLDKIQPFPKWKELFGFSKLLNL